MIDYCQLLLQNQQLGEVPSLYYYKTRLEFITGTIIIYESNYLVCYQFSLARNWAKVIKDML